MVISWSGVSSWMSKNQEDFISGVEKKGASSAGADSGAEIEAEEGVEVAVEREA